MNYVHKKISKNDRKDKFLIDFQDTKFFEDNQNIFL